MKRRRDAFGFSVLGVYVVVSWGWRWRWLYRTDEGFKVCFLGVLLEVGRWGC